MSTPDERAEILDRVKDRPWPNFDNWAAKTIPALLDELEAAEQRIEELEAHANALAVQLRYFVDEFGNTPVTHSRDKYRDVQVVGAEVEAALALLDTEAKP